MVAFNFASNFNFGMQQRLAISIGLIAALLASASKAPAIEVKHLGTLDVPTNAQLFVFSTDPVIQRVLSQDFQAQGRRAEANSRSPVTVTVTVSEQMLKPGVSLATIAPGRPQVADLLQELGANAPPIGDTGTEVDRAAVSRRLELNPQPPSDTPMEQVMNGMQGPSPFQPYLPNPFLPYPYLWHPQTYTTPPPPTPHQGAPGYVGDTQQYMAQGGPGNYQKQGDQKQGDKDLYDTVVVAQASVSGKPGIMIVVALAHPGDDIRELKESVAEEIANAVLH